MEKEKEEKRYRSKEEMLWDNAKALGLSSAITGAIIGTGGILAEKTARNTKNLTERDLDIINKSKVLKGIGASLIVPGLGLTAYKHYKDKQEKKKKNDKV